MLRFYARTLAGALRWPALVLSALALIVALNIYLFIVIPKGLFPQQDTGRLVGGIRADQSASFELMRDKLTRFIRILGDDPAVASVTGFTGGGRTNSGFVFVALKPLAERDVSAAQVVARLRPKLAQVAGARLFLQAVQDIRVGGRESFAQYQYTLQADDLHAALRMGAAHHGRAGAAAATDRCQFRSAAGRARNQAGDRPRDRRPARRDRAADRQHAV